MKPNVMVEHADKSFEEWRKLLALLHAAFDYQKNRIDPPSSLYRLDESSLAKKSENECLLLARIDGELVGCVFAKEMSGFLYLGKLAVFPYLQGQGVGKHLVHAVENLARKRNQRVLELETRIELEENHKTFCRLGFIKVSEGAHEGYDKPTFITMRKQLCA
ncbi:MAG: GNAT family N-acetyltransferase [Gammaproteobacteria bacterium]|nr:GNAT family N-acetyltransferase [Gammaproteobacteria bacterium]